MRFPTAEFFEDDSGEGKVYFVFPRNMIKLRGFNCAMRTEKLFPAKELVFREDDGTYYAVSLSFGLFAEGETAEEAWNNLKHATIGYLIMCVKENESDEQIYRGAPKEYIALSEQFAKWHVKPLAKEASKRYAMRTQSYSKNDSYITA